LVAREIMKKQKTCGRINETRQEYNFSGGVHSAELQRRDRAR